MAKFFGLDIGTTSIKLVQSDTGVVSKIGMIPNKFGKSLSQMSNSERITFTDDIKKMLSDFGVKETSVVASLPESLTFSKVMRFPRMSTPELATAIKWELDQSVPFPPNEIESSWSLLNRKDKPEDILEAYVVAVPGKVSELYVQLFELLSLEPLRLENEVVPLIRAFSPFLAEESPSFIVDIGGSGVKIILADKNVIYNNYYFSVGGVAMTRLIAESFGLNLEQAEQYKRTYGLQQGQLDGKMFALLKPIIDNFILEVRKMSISYKNDYAKESVSKMILTGGGSYLTGLIPYLTSQLDGVEVYIGNSFEGVQVEADYQQLGSVFGLALGLSS